METIKLTSHQLQLDNTQTQREAEQSVNKRSHRVKDWNHQHQLQREERTEERGVDEKAEEMRGREERRTEDRRGLVFKVFLLTH